MFSSLESNWDHSARRGRATLASFTLQAFGLSLLVAISMLWVERPPQVHWLQISAPAFAPQHPAPPPGRPETASGGNPNHGAFTAPREVPRETPRINDPGSGPVVPDAPTIDYGPSNGPIIGIDHGVGSNIPIVIPPRPAMTKPLPVSHWAEGNLIFRVQPVYPALARQARIQGSVQLRAIISKAGTIENLAVVSGHPMLVKSAIDAVRQWRYRPYLLNGDPVEVETEVTVNFLLSGG